MRYGDWGGQLKGGRGPSAFWISFGQAGEGEVKKVEISWPTVLVSVACSVVVNYVLAVAFFNNLDKKTTEYLDRVSDITIEAFKQKEW